MVDSHDHPVFKALEPIQATILALIVVSLKNLHRFLSWHTRDIPQKKALNFLKSHSGDCAGSGQIDCKSQGFLLPSPAMCPYHNAVGCVWVALSRHFGRNERTRLRAGCNSLNFCSQNPPPLGLKRLHSGGVLLFSINRPWNFW